MSKTQHPQWAPQYVNDSRSVSPLDTPLSRSGENRQLKMSRSSTSSSSSTIFLTILSICFATLASTVSATQNPFHFLSLDSHLKNGLLGPVKSTSSPPHLINPVDKQGLDFLMARFLRDYYEKYRFQDRLENEVNNVHKRAPFSSWGGKRSLPRDSMSELEELAHEQQEEGSRLKRKPFSAWGGKRSELPLHQDSETSEMAKRGVKAFSAWGGKRSAGFDEDSFLRRYTRNVDGMIPVRVLRPHRASFSAWGGK